ncbi:hypothetical protein ACFPYJ_01820 [Paenibacillus solisilvae]|uniref:Uncharacterized protein n=1 Tax=Paenibacillus solisilvae TaxID=2486751 RepID=A0ABW0VQ16_9BACL
MLLVTIIAAVLVIRYEFPLLLKKKLHKELWVFSILIAFGLLLSILQGLQIPIPNPLDWITAIFKPMSRMILSA